MAGPWKGGRLLRTPGKVRGAADEGGVGSFRCAPVFAAVKAAGHCHNCSLTLRTRP